MTDYSQSGEQKHILAWAAHRPAGRWLDIGAFDGTTASNTRALAQQGWPGVAVEPAAWAFDQLGNLYAGREDVECVQAAVFCRMQPPIVRFYYTHDLVSTADQAHADTWKADVDFSRVWLPALRLSDLLDAFPGPYDLVSIDTEGTSIELWNDLRIRREFARGALAVVEAEDGEERRLIQDACKDGWARVAVTPNNVLLERL